MIFGAKIQLWKETLMCCKMRLFGVIFSHCESTCVAGAFSIFFPRLTCHFGLFWGGYIYNLHTCFVYFCYDNEETKKCDAKHISDLWFQFMLLASLVSRNEDDLWIKIAKIAFQISQSWSIFRNQKQNVIEQRKWKSCSS